ncbi:hypothetical protein SEA_KILKOR_76 [Mycobacterium phage KilKor]|uniref:Uncharacterized protein n=2 Tax=Fishburnevirus TaxID=1983734 RepID=A0A6B9SZN5_9CAUD|nr:hypothetical protein I5J38_gp77 [Mycobacterium phage Willsammy]YP_009964330.1 hypothetical protein I5J39_gp75 [Mycobacterium phage Megiddo]YP_010001377.1 hypothetical protein J1N47_gp76 [Mycobacterium phage KilKor]QHB41343.1 hypothetical protein SEA_PHALM_76 [Mycobacterium phage Phalm]QHB41499.1 hypothetical protein SEA_GLASKE_75 [Mycobacterium phage Glaske]QHJ86334.1 hypothetical protein SEA_CACTUSJACK_76 [Mycobacterium phage CactusJack]QIG57668.1 hypothetical protein SEA_STRESSBALL_75 [M
MRKRIALALIKLAHKVYPPTVTETLGDDGQPVALAFDRLAAGLAGARPALPDASAAELGVEMANHAIQRMVKLHGDAGRAVRDAYSFDSYREQLDKMRAARNPINRKGLGPLTHVRYDE